jgi:hypothetical protein
MSTVAEDQQARLGDIDQIDRIELRIAERLFPDRRQGGGYR